MKVSEILKHDNAALVVVKPNMSILLAAHRMRMEKVGCVVVSKDGKHPDGIVAVRDIVYRMADHWGDKPSGREFSYIQTPVSEIMTHPVKTCTKKNNLKDVLQMMWHYHHLHIPVLDNNKELCGIISIDDVIKFSVHEMETEAQVLRERIMLGGTKSNL